MTLQALKRHLARYETVRGVWEAFWEAMRTRRSTGGSVAYTLNPNDPVWWVVNQAVRKAQTLERLQGGGREKA